MRESRAVAVGQDPEPVATLRGTKRACAETTPLRIEPHRGKVFKHMSQAFLPQSRHVFEKDKGGTAVLDDTRDQRPKPTRVCCATTGPSHRRGLAWESRSDAIHNSTPCPGIKAGEIRPDRSLSQVTRLHLEDQNRGSRSFPLHVTDAARRASGRKTEPELESTITGAEGEDVEGMYSQLISALVVRFLVQQPGERCPPSCRKNSQKNSGLRLGGIKGPPPQTGRSRLIRGCPPSWHGSCLMGLWRGLLSTGPQVYRHRPVCVRLRVSFHERVDNRPPVLILRAWH